MNHLIVFDFDGTLARTSQPSQRGIDVATAYRYAVTDIFGEEGYVVYMNELGGLQNREPGELVEAVCSRLGRGKDYMKQLTEDLVEAKLSYLLPEVSPEWPALVDGVKEFFQKVESGEIPVDVGIVSSGHDAFIKRVFEVNDLKTPDILVTSDVLREKSMPDRPRYKPNPYQMAVAHRLWLNSKKNEHAVLPGPHKEALLYVGDDPVRDGGLAQRSRVPFIAVPFTGNGFTPDPEIGQLSVNGFDEITRLFADNAQLLREGASMTDVLFGKPYEQVFPPGEGLYQRLLHNHMARR